MLFVLNPRSGKEWIKGQLMEILGIFTKAGYESRVHATQKQEDAMEVVARLDKKVNVVVCSGRDGTFSETIPGMMKLKRIPLLGYIPAGSTNDFTTNLGVPERMPLAIWDIVEGTPFAIDTRTFYEDMNSVYAVVFGISTEVSYLTSQDRKDLLGHQAYVLEGVRNLAGLRPYHIKAERDGQVLEEDFASGMVTNTISVGGFRRLVNQSVVPNDGFFEALLIWMPRTLVDSSSIISYMFLRKEPSEYVYKLKASSIRLTSEQEVDWMLSGEYDGSRTKVTIGNIRENVQILLRNHPEEGSEWRQVK